MSMTWEGTEVSTVVCRSMRFIQYRLDRILGRLPRRRKCERRKLKVTKKRSAERLDSFTGFTSNMASLQRGSVKADNSCLFTALARLCENIVSEPQLKVAARKLRATCAAAVLADPDPATKAILLGHDSVEAYGQWITDDHHWGGEPEIVMLSAHYGVEIVVVSCEALNFLRYADGAPETRVYLLYTGQHYDPLLGEDGALRFMTADPSEVVEAREGSALVLARTHNREAAERALEKRVNKLKCCGCGMILDDAAAFQEHCGSVEHDDDFSYDCEQVDIVLRAMSATDCS